MSARPPAIIFFTKVYSVAECQILMFPPMAHKGEEQLPNRIRSLRKARGWTLSQLATAVGMTTGASFGSSVSAAVSASSVVSAVRKTGLEGRVESD